MKRLRLTIAVIFLFLLPASIACSASTAPVPEQATTMSVRIIVTQNFGQELILDRTLDTGEKSNAMDTLQRVAQVETAYGGGFVISINGIRSQYSGLGSAQQDWFLYINGMESNTGALDYTLQPGDIEHWDFHNWSFHQSIPAIIDSFPGTFKYGYGGNTRPTIIAYADGFNEAADNLEQGLIASGVKVSSQNLDELSENAKESSNLLLLGTSDNQLISELNREWQRLGFFADFENGNLVALSPDGHVETRYGAGVGLIEATQNPWNPNGTSADQNAVWLVSGTDVNGVNAAADILLKHSEELKYSFAVVVSGGKAINLPEG